MIDFFVYFVLPWTPFAAYYGQRSLLRVSRSYKKFTLPQSVLDPEVKKRLISREIEEKEIESSCTTHSNMLVHGPISM